MKKFLTAVVTSGLALSASSSTGKTIDGAYVGCISKRALDEFVSAANNQDYRHMEALTGSVCASIEGREYSIVDQGWMTSQIRVFVDGSSVLLWTVSEALR